MVHNRYFIVEANNPNLPQIFEVTVGAVLNQRYSIDTTKVVVKLHQGDHSNYPFLSGIEEYTHSEILEIMHTPEWQEEMPIIDNI